MFEKERPLENKESKEQTPRPNLLDIVKIDERWAQVIWGGDHIQYLDDESKIPINWDDFQLIKNWEELPVWSVKKSTSFTQVELEHIHWGPEQEQDPHLREEVSVFGEFKKSKKNEGKLSPNTE